MARTRLIGAIRDRIGEIPFLFLCMAIWVFLVSLLLAAAGFNSVLSGFWLGAVGSAVYGVLLYHRVPALLSRPFSPSITWTEVPAHDFSRRRRFQDRLRQLWRAWAKTLQPIMAIALVILAVSRIFANLSLPAALFGFLSFQMSLFLYAILISIDS